MAAPQALSVNPGKVIAVHVAFASRANQRGRWPKKPSYFLKATSSLADSGQAAVRPKGTELLAFEGEIALIIGQQARNIPVDKAWDYVSAVTASNDLGIYDFRAQDKGSNTRSKSRDGYTPIGPNLIDVTDIGPEQLRIRTWINGELVQQGTTTEQDLIFPLPQFVADLSQHMTLEPGDIILTGTPAGSTVVNSGDVVDVEVDAPETPGNPSSGKLSTPIIDGDQEFDPSVGMLPAVDEKQREEAFGSREAAGLPDDPMALPTSLRKQLEQAPTAGLSAALRSKGINQCVIEGVRAQTKGTTMVGVARTLRFVPGREDLFRAHGGGLNTQKQVFDTVRNGEVIVIEARGDQEAGTLGDILALRAYSRGAAGVVTDGKVRDFEAVADIGLPVFSQGSHPCVLGRRHVPWDQDIAVACGNATVIPGDIIVGDDDGVIVIPRDLVEEVLSATLAKEHQDQWVATQVSQGRSIDGLFPPTGDNKAAYQEYVKANPVPLDGSDLSNSADSQQNR